MKSKLDHLVSYLHSELVKTNFHNHLFIQFVFILPCI